MFDFFKKLLGFKEKPLPPPKEEVPFLPQPPKPSPSEEELEKEDVDVVEELIMEQQPVMEEQEVEVVEQPVMEGQEVEFVEQPVMEEQENEEGYVTNMPEHNLVDSDDFNPVIDDEEHEGDRELRALEEEEESE